MELPGYTIHHEIGRGGMARVYLATQRKFGRQVALKVVAADLARDDDFRRRFIEESRINARMTHQNIVQVYDVGTEGELLYLVMEYLSGGDLNQRLERGMHVHDLIRVVSDVGRALDFAHRQGFVHRDIKPENILFREDGSAVLTDFGIARVVDDSPSMSDAGTVIGTPQYMSPEQAAGKALDGRSDLYSLGVVFYRMLTGDVPYKAQTAVSIGVKHLQEPVPRLPGYLSPFQEVVDRALAKKPELRYQSGAEMAAALELVRSSVALPNATVRSQAVTTQEIRAAGSSLFSAARDPARGNRHARRRRGRPISPTVLSVVLLTLVIGGASLVLTQQPQWVTRLLAVVGVAEDPAVQEAWNSARSLREDPNQGLSTIVAGYRRVLNLDPDHQGARNALAGLASEWNSDITDALAQGNLRLAETKLAESSLAFPDDPDLDRLAELLANRKHAERLLSSTQALLRSHGLSDIPSATAAIQAYQEVLRLAPGHRLARAELDALGRHYATLAGEAADAGELEQAIDYLDRATAANGDLPELAQVRDRMQQATAAQSALRRLVEQADRYRQAGSLINPPGENAAELYHRVLAADPGNAAAVQGMNAVVAQLGSQADALLRQGDLDGVRSLLGRAGTVGLDQQAVNRIKSRVDAEADRRAEVVADLEDAEALLNRGFITEPPGRNAVAILRDVERRDPGNRYAKALLTQAATRLAQVAREAHAAGHTDEARRFLDQALTVTPGVPQWQELRAEWQQDDAGQ